MMPHVPEVEFLLAASQVRFGDTELARCREILAGNAGFDWGYLLDQSARHRVMALLARNFEAHDLYSGDSGKRAVRVPHGEVFRSQLLYHRQRNAELLPAHGEVIAALESADVPVLARKGGYLAVHAYPEPGIRPMKDLDLLVPPDQAHHAVTVLTDLGFQAGQGVPAGQTFQDGIRDGKAVPMMSRPTDSPYVPAVRVDLCLALFLPGTPFRMPSEEIFARATTHRHPATGTLRMAPEDFVIDVAAHLYKESTTLRYIRRRKHQRLLQYWDLLLAVTHFGAGLSWSRLVDRAYHLGVERPLYFCLSNAAELASGDVPADMLTEMRQRTPGIDEVRQQYGLSERPQPLVWHNDFMTRMFDASHTVEMPAARALV